jgi:hypothetical protein
MWRGMEFASSAEARTVMEWAIPGNSRDRVRVPGGAPGLEAHSCDGRGQVVAVPGQPQPAAGGVVVAVRDQMPEHP